MKASNIQAMVRTIAVHRRPVSAAFPYAQGLTIRISKTIWNICESQKNPQTHRITQTTSKRKSTSRSDQRRRKKRPGKTTIREASEFAVESAKERQQVSPSSQPTRCKVKLWRFLYGQPKANSITYETPCLHPTCANCWIWHPHLVGQPQVPDELFGQWQRDQALPDFEPISPQIDPRLLDDTWLRAQSRSASVESGASLETLSVESNAVLIMVTKGSRDSETRCEEGRVKQAREQGLGRSGSSRG
jgi:hypothetical protein